MTTKCGSGTETNITGPVVSVIDQKMSTARSRTARVPEEIARRFTNPVDASRYYKLSKKMESGGISNLTTSERTELDNLHEMERCWIRSMSVDGQVPNEILDQFHDQDDAKRYYILMKKIESTGAGSLTKDEKTELSRLRALRNASNT
jgi:hypothetical protein